MGAALGGNRLESLSIGPVELLGTPADAERTLFALPLSFPRLRSLTISLQMNRPTPLKDTTPSPCGLKLLAPLKPLDELLPCCPALQLLRVQVRVFARAAGSCSDRYEFARHVRVRCAALSAAHPGKRVAFEWH